MSTKRKAAAPAPLPRHPLYYAPELDPVGKDEAKLARAIADTMLEIARTTHANSGHAIRSVHAKSHGLLRGELEVLPDLPPEFAQGVFARPAAYPVVMRLSTIPGDILPDSVSTPRGMAIKLIGVSGARLEGSEGVRTQDFIGVNMPVFSAPSPQAFLSSLKVVASTTDRIKGIKRAISAIARLIERLLKPFHGRRAVLKALGGEPPNHILGETFWTQLPIRYGDHIAKLQIVPVSPNLLALRGQPLDLHDGPNVIRQAVIEFFSDNTAVWEVRAQLATDLDDTPIADATREWKEEISPFVTVARITARAQLAWSRDRSIAIDDGMGFSPWNGIEDHRPLGAFMRIRRLAYAESRRFRSERNPTPVREPYSINAVPD